MIINVKRHVSTGDCVGKVFLQYGCHIKYGLIQIEILEYCDSIGMIQILRLTYLRQLS